MKINTESNSQLMFKSGSIESAVKDMNKISDIKAMKIPDDTEKQNKNVFMTKGVRFDSKA